MSKERKGFLKGAYDLHTPEDSRAHYDQWADSYDDSMTEYRYVAPRKCAQMLADHICAGEVMDIGCGTGLVAAALKTMGEFVIDGADISPNMLAQAKSKGLYRRLQTADILQGIDAADNQYEAAVSAGTFTVGHVGPQGLPEVMRIIKPGGLLAFTVNETVYEKDKYPEYLAEWQNQSQIAPLQHFHAPYIAETDTAGFYILLKVLR